MRNFPPDDGYFDFVRKITSENGTVLIFDECTSGFRETFGGLHNKYSISPDLCVYGKTIGNGYALTAVVGSLPIMKKAQATLLVLRSGQSVLAQLPL